MEALLKGHVEELPTTFDKANLEITDQYVEGFNEAMEHVKCLAPELDLTSTDPFNEVFNGEIIKATEEEGNWG
ncbi:hypothetical protein VNO78_16822 [Psophocarpus tetragonolobus]|uniref:Uncharacterized protein n=1 Tax=Psophocarpus tetragonolobus TaxID=3891 RepID=A0AAN9XKQ4_PSOTE